MKEKQITSLSPAKRLTALFIVLVLLFGFVSHADITNVPRVEAATTRYTYVVDVFNYDSTDSAKWPNLTDESHNNAQIDVVHQSYDKFHRMTFTSEYNDLSVRVTNGSTSNCGVFGDGRFRINPQYSHVYLVGGNTTAENPKDPPITYYMSATDDGQIKLTAIKAQSQQTLRLMYYNSLTTKDQTIDYGAGNPKTTSLSQVQELVPSGQSYALTGLNVHSLETNDSIPPSTEIWFKARTAYGNSSSSQTLFGKGTSDNTPGNDKNAQFTMPENGIMIPVVNSNTEWKYLADNSDPFNATNSKLYQAITANGNESRLNDYRTAWSLPISPYFDATLDTLTDGSKDIGYSCNEGIDGWKSGKGAFGFKYSSSGTNTTPPISWRTLGTQLDSNISGTSDRAATYFFRYDFDLDADDITSIRSAYYKLQYNDAVIIYLNGHEIGRHNVPDAGYSQNVEYGCSNAVNDYEEKVKKTTIPDNLLRDGSNTLAVELHQESTVSSDIYLNFENFTLLESEFKDAITGINLSPGSDEYSRNFAWLSNTQEANMLMVWKDGEQARTFEADKSEQQSNRNGYTTYKATATVEPGTKYYYKIINGNPDKGGTESDTYTFTTDSSTSTFSFLLAGDPQIGKGGLKHDIQWWKNSISVSMNKWPGISFIVNVGDQVDYCNSEIEYDGYLSPAELKGIPVATTVGNHDGTTMSGGPSMNYLGHFNVPNLGGSGSDGYTSKGGGDYWYTYGNVLLMHINTNNGNTEQHKRFMEGAISTYKADHDTDPDWKILVMHYGAYTSVNHTTDGSIRQLRWEMSPIVAELDIDVVLNGHDHVYTRTYMMGSPAYSNNNVGGGFTPIKEEGYTAVGNDQYAEYTKSQKGEAVYITANSASGCYLYGDYKPDYDFVAVHDQAFRPTISKIDVTADSLRINSYYTAKQGNFSNSQGKQPYDPNSDVEDINEPVLFDSFTIRRPNVVTPSKNTVTFHANGGAGNMDPQEFESGEAQKLKANVFAKTNHTFAGWGESAAGQKVYTNEQSVTLTESIALFALWTPDTYNIGYNLNGGNLPADTKTSYSYGSGFSLPVPTRTGYTFDGWYVNSGLTDTRVAIITDTDNGNKEYWAKWSANKYTVRFNKTASKASGNGYTQTFTYGTDQKITANKFKLKGYIFLGWATTQTNAENGKIAYETNASLTTFSTGGATNLFAVWGKATAPKRASLPKVTNKKKGQLIISYKKPKGTVSGYIVDISTDKKFAKKKTDSKTIKNSNPKDLKITKVKNKKLKIGTSYYIRVKAYRLDSAGAKVFGKVSKTKKVTVKK